MLCSQWVVSPYVCASGRLLTGAIFTVRAPGAAMVVPARRDEHDQVCSIIETFEGPGRRRTRPGLAV